MASLTNGWKLFSAAALTAAMLFTAVPAKAEAIPDGGTFTVTWAQNPVSLNPGLSSGISSGIPGAQLLRARSSTTTSGIRIPTLPKSGRWPPTA